LTNTLNLGAGAGTILRNALLATQVGVAANYVVDDETDFAVLVDTTAGAYNITLPASVDGKLICVKDAANNALANNITILTPGAETIDTAANLVLAADDDGVVLMCDGTDWWALAGY
jgi:hypothetical protein